MALTRRRRLLRRLGVGLFAVLAAATPTVRAQASSLPADYFGIHGLFLVQAPGPVPDGQLDDHLRAIEKLGITSVRTDAAWQIVEPAPPLLAGHRYHWAPLDRIVTLLARSDLRWLPVVDYSAPWASSQPGNFLAPPLNVAAYAEYAGALAGRYGRGGSFWAEHENVTRLPVRTFEVWNEPNWPYFWPPAPNPAAYANMYLAARSAIHRADPRALATVGGLTGEAADFVAAMYEARPDLRGNVDEVGAHPYAPSVAKSIDLLERLRTTLDHVDPNRVPIAVTEVGWPTAGPDSTPFRTSDGERADRLGALARALPRSDLRISRFIPHTWVTAERNRATIEDWFGIVHPDGSPTATSEAYGQAIDSFDAMKRHAPPDQESGALGLAALLGLARALFGRSPA